jgi:hypothetical protein
LLIRLLRGEFALLYGVEVWAWLFLGIAGNDLRLLRVGVELI